MQYIFFGDVTSHLGLLAQAQNYLGKLVQCHAVLMAARDSYLDLNVLGSIPTHVKITAPLRDVGIRFYYFVASRAN